MCGRFVRKSHPEEIAEAFELKSIQTDIAPSYNIAPTQNIAAIVHSYKFETHALVNLKWGLVPRWAKDRSMAAKMINARSETLSQKPSFRNAFKKRRCLIVANGFYEWKKENNQKQATYIHLPEQELITFAGIFEGWKSPEGETIYSCSIITTQANPLLQPIHHRMPVILNKDNHAIWLDPNISDPHLLSELFKTYPAEQMETYPISDFVNKASNNSPLCIKRKEVA